MYVKLGPLVFALTYVMSMVYLTPLVSSQNGLQEHERNNTINMFYLGTINGKSYYTETSAKTWTAAKDFCINSGMHLASITTLQQVNFLDSMRNCSSVPGRFCGSYWIGGRSINKDISQFQWDQNNQTVVNPGLPYDSPATSDICLAYDTGTASAEEGKLFTASCSTTMQQLCETVHGD